MNKNDDYLELVCTVIDAIFYKKKMRKELSFTIRNSFMDRNDQFGISVQQ